MGAIFLLTERAAKGPTAVPASVHQLWEPLVAGETDGFGVVVRADRPRDVMEEHLSGQDVSRGNEKSSTPRLMVDGVWKALVMLTVCVLHLTTCGTVGSNRAV